MLSAADGWGGESGRPHLGRAFSVCRTRDGRLEFLLEAIGPGTERLAELEAGDGLWVVGPLGIGFTQPPPGSRALLVGGGIGIAPLVIWAEALRGRLPDASLLGFRSGEYAEAAALLPGDVLVATDDGTGPGRPSRTGHRPARSASSPRRDVVYACGPHADARGGQADLRRTRASRRSSPWRQAWRAASAPASAASCDPHGFRRLCVDGPVVRAAELAEDWH